MAKEATLKIGNSFADLTGTLDQVSKAIEGIFKAGFDNRMEQETVRTALETLGKLAKVDNVTVTNSTFKGDKTININDEDEESLNE